MCVRACMWARVCVCVWFEAAMLSTPLPARAAHVCVRALPAALPVPGAILGYTHLARPIPQDSSPTLPASAVCRVICMCVACSSNAGDLVTGQSSACVLVFVCVCVHTSGRGVVMVAASHLCTVVVRTVVVVVVVVGRHHVFVCVRPVFVGGGGRALVLRSALQWRWVICAVMVRTIVVVVVGRGVVVTAGHLCTVVVVVGQHPVFVCALLGFVLYPEPVVVSSCTQQCCNSGGGHRVGSIMLPMLRNSTHSRRKTHCAYLALPSPAPATRLRT